MNMMVTYEEPSSVSAKHTPGAVLNMGSVSKESACNAGDPSSIPGLGRSAGKGIVYLVQYSWGSLLAQLIKNLPSKQETWVGKIPCRRERLPTSVF